MPRPLTDPIDTHSCSETQERLGLPSVQLSAKLWARKKLSLMLPTPHRLHGQPLAKQSPAQLKVPDGETEVSWGLKEEVLGKVWDSVLALPLSVILGKQPYLPET